VQCPECGREHFSFRLDGTVEYRCWDCRNRYKYVSDLGDLSNIEMDNIEVGLN
jgi:transposase-like protein